MDRVENTCSSYVQNRSIVKVLFLYMNKFILFESKLLIQKRNGRELLRQADAQADAARGRSRQLLGMQTVGWAHHGAVRANDEIRIVDAEQLLVAVEAFRFADPAVPACRHGLLAPPQAFVHAGVDLDLARGRRSRSRRRASSGRGRRCRSYNRRW